jgi:hypothetical protein
MTPFGISAPIRRDNGGMKRVNQRSWMEMRKLSLGLAAIVVAAGLSGAAFAADEGALTTDLSAAKTVKKTTTVKHSAGGAKTVKKTTTVKRTGAANTAVRRNVVVVRRPYRAWAARPYYGTAIIGGVALGTVIAVSAAHAYPAPPGPNACWYWSNPAETHGYWDYCTPP